MDFALTDTQKDIQSMAAKFAAKELAPIADADELNATFRREIFTKAGEAGILGIHAAEEFGGSGLGSFEYSLVLEALAYRSAGYATSLSVTALPQTIIQQYGNEEQKKKFIPDIISGKKIGAFCLTEPSSGSDASSLKTTAVKQGDHYVLNGVKQFITNGGNADLLIVLARTGGPGAKGISSFLVEKGSPGLKGGKIEKKMGMRVSVTQEMLFDNVKVPAANLIGEEGKGFGAAMLALDSGRISIASIANGISRAALDKAVAYAKEREQFKQPIIQFQGVGFLLADMATELEASVLLTRKAAWHRDNGEPCAQTAAMAKLKATDVCMRVTTDAVQVLGGYGYMEEFTVERYMREAKVLQIVEGTNQIQRVIISRTL